jgi:DNA-binding MarR family transcriptional regulator
MSNQSSSKNSFALASRFLHALQNLNKVLNASNVRSGFEHLNLSQIRIVQSVHDDPGIRADVVIDRLELAPDTAKRLILAMEKAGLLSLDRSTQGDPPNLRLGAHGQRLAFQVNATQLVIVAELLGKLSEADQLVAVEALEQITAQQLE